MIFLSLGLLCGLAARILLITAAFGISKKWGFGVFFPFGPLFFRLSYPDEARRARLFQLATLPCMFLYVIISPELMPSTRVGFVHLGPPGHEKLALVAGSYTFKFGSGYGTESAPPKPLDLKERRAAMEREFQRLQVWSEKLRTRKRDLLKSDTEGALAYNRDATEFNAAVDKANNEKFAIALLEK